MSPSKILYGWLWEIVEWNIHTAVLFITSVSTIIVVIADVSARNTLAVTALKLTAAAPLGWKQTRDMSIHDTISSKLHKAEDNYTWYVFTTPKGAKSMNIKIKFSIQYSIIRNRIVEPEMSLSSLIHPHVVQALLLPFFQFVYFITNMQKILVICRPKLKALKHNLCLFSFHTAPGLTSLMAKAIGL